MLVRRITGMGSDGFDGWWRRYLDAVEVSRGVDGAVLGLALVFLAKVNLMTLLGLGVPPSIGDPLAGSVSLASGSPLRPLLGILALPLFLFGWPAYALDAALVWLGGWIALLVPGWYWVAAPLLARFRRRGPSRR